MRTILNNTKNTKLGAAITTSLAPSIAPAPAAPVVLPANMPADRAAAFRKSVADRLREGTAYGNTQAAMLTAIRSEQEALAKALLDHDFVHAMATLYIAELAANSHAAVPMEQAHLEMESILKNRVADAHGFLTLLSQPAFLAAAAAEAHQPAAAHTAYTLPPRKIDETVRRLVQPQDVDGAEPAVHVAASARGQQATHQALANIFRPTGALRAPLVHALATAWPHASGAQIEQLASTWLKARHDPAHSVADALKPTGEIYAQAMRQAQAIQNQKLGAAIAAAPAPIATAPITHVGTVKPAPDLVMEI